MAMNPEESRLGKFGKFLALVLGSALFFPVSCMTGLVTGIKVVAKLDTREVARGDAVHPDFCFVAEPGVTGEPFQVVSFSRYSEFREAGGAYSFLMAKPGLALDMGPSTFSGATTYSYRVLDEAGGEQLIEVVQRDHDGDYSGWYRYKATKASITPVSSRVNHPGQMFAALPFAFGGALILYVIGRALRRRYRAPARAEN